MLHIACHRSSSASMLLYGGCGAALQGVEDERLLHVNVRTWQRMLAMEGQASEDGVCVCLLWEVGGAVHGLSPA